jgi:hypothetical protein
MIDWSWAALAFALGLLVGLELTMWRERVLARDRKELGE